jgi:hypothetical protein
MTDMERRPGHSLQRPPWTPDETERVRNLILSGKSIEAISRVVGRTPSAIRKTASKLRLPLRKIGA